MASKDIDFPLPPPSFPLELLKPLVRAVLDNTDLIPGWPAGRVALEEKEAAVCIGLKAHVLRDARLRLRLSHARVGRSVIYSADHLKSAIDRLSKHS